MIAPFANSEVLCLPLWRASAKSIRDIEWNINNRPIFSENGHVLFIRAARRMLRFSRPLKADESDRTRYTISSFNCVRRSNDKRKVDTSEILFGIKLPVCYILCPYARETRFGFDRSGVGYVERPHGGSYCPALQRRWKSDHIGFLRRDRQHLGYKNFRVSLIPSCLLPANKFQSRIYEFIRLRAQVNLFGSAHYVHLVIRNHRLPDSKRHDRSTLYHFSCFPWHFIFCWPAKRGFEYSRYIELSSIQKKLIST